MLYEIKQDEKDYLQQVKSIKLYDIDWKEKDLENIISKNIPLFIPENQLMILAQERQHQEEADILALDKNGALFIFELKRWESTKENILQVLRYGQIFGQYDYASLQNIFRKYQKDENLSLDEKHFNHFNEVIENKLEKTRFNQDQHFVVITNGIDLDTLNAVKYWKEKGLQIDCLPYKLYRLDENIFLEFNSFNPQNEVIIDEDMGFFVVNTNITWSDVNYREMLDQEIAAAYGDRRFGIKRIKKNNEVFLYHNRVGIIAHGKAISEPIEEGEKMYVKLKFNWKIDPNAQADQAVGASEINQKLNSGYSFRQTVFAIPKDMADTIKEIKKSKTA